MTRYGTGRYTSRIAERNDEVFGVHAEDVSAAFDAFAAAGHPVKLARWERDVNGDHTRGDLVKWYRLSATAFSAFDDLSEGRVPVKVNGNTMNGLINKGLITSYLINKGLITSYWPEQAKLTRAGWLLAAAYAEADGDTATAQACRQRAEAARVALPRDL